MARRPTRPLGRMGEEIAAAFLSRRGLRVRARNLRSRLGEMDLVCEDGDTLVFVEVKARHGEGGDPPQAAVDGRKQARLARLALDYLARERLVERRCRFDVVAVTFDASGEPTPHRARVAHFRDAFTVAG